MPRRRYLDKAAPADNRTITIGQIPRGYVDSHGDMVVRTPKGVKTTLQEAYEKYNQTPVAVENIPGLTDYLITQDNNDIQEAAHMRKIAGDRFVHQLGEERDKALMAIAAGAFGGGALASGLALAPVATLGSIGGGILGENAWNRIYGNTWGQDVERWTNGYIPAPVGEYLNPGSLIGGGLGSQVGKIPNLTYKGFLRMPQTKRAVEVAMRTTSASDPISYIQDDFNALRKTKEGRRQLRYIANYVLTGAKPKDKTISYRSFSPIKDNEYTGFYFPLGYKGLRPTTDIIDAYLYGKEIDPRFLRLIDKGDNFGIHNDYINKMYPNKAKNIPVYEGGLGSSSGYPQFNDPIAYIESRPNINYSQPLMTRGTSGSIRTLHPEVGVNSAGHIVGLDINGNRINQDIWKFEPKAYKDKWFIGDPSWNPGLKAILKEPIILKELIQHNIKQKLPNIGLKIVNDIGTPVITRTKPYGYRSLWDVTGGNMNMLDPRKNTQYSIFRR